MSDLRTTMLAEAVAAFPDPPEQQEILDLFAAGDSAGLERLGINALMMTLLMHGKLDGWNRMAQLALGLLETMKNEG